MQKLFKETTEENENNRKILLNWFNDICQRLHTANEYDSCKKVKKYLNDNVIDCDFECTLYSTKDNENTKLPIDCVIISSMLRKYDFSYCITEGKLAGATVNLKDASSIFSYNFRFDLEYHIEKTNNEPTNNAEETNNEPTNEPTNEPANNTDETPPTDELTDEEAF